MAKGAAEDDAPKEPLPSKDEPPTEAEVAPLRTAPSHPPNDSARPPRNGVYQQALSQALPSGPTSAQKRAASARSPSPSHPNKFRKTDLPTGPRAHRDGPTFGSRSLIDRVSGPANRNNAKDRDEIQARIDSIVNSATEQNMMPPGFPPMMDMNMAAANMTNPLLIQEMMMNQMVLMAQMATSMGIINPATGQFAGQEFPMQQGPMLNDIGMFPPPASNGYALQQGGPIAQNNNNNNTSGGRGRGNVRGGRGTGRGRGGSVATGQSGPSPSVRTEVQEPAPPAPPVVPVPVAPTPVIATPTVATPAVYAVPERPSSPTLCKFGLKCTNGHCRYSHPSPVATVESGIVLSNDPCERGKDCKDKDCVKAHVSPAALNPNRKKLPCCRCLVLKFYPAEQSIPKASVPPPPVSHNTIACRFGNACTRPGCTFSHPARSTPNSVPCRFGAACTRAQCPFQHPDGRVLPSSFHRGLSTSGPMVKVSTPEPGSMGGPSHHRSVTFNNPNASMKEKLEKQMKEIEEKKMQTEMAVKAAEAAANSKKESANAVPITA